MRDRHYERRLDEVGVAWEYSDKVALSAITETVQSRVITAGEIPEQVRLHENNARTAGTTHYPPLILGARSGKEYVLLDGHQRLGGFRRAGVTAHDAYLVNDPTQWDLAARAINTDHGLPNTEEERLVRAKESVRGGMSQAEAANLWRVSQSMLGYAIRADRVDAIAISEGVSARLLERVPQTTKVWLHKISRPIVLKAATEAIVRSGAKGDDAKAVVEMAISARSDSEALDKLSRIAASKPSENNKPVASTAVITSCSRLLTSLRKYPPAEITSQDERRRVKGSVEEVAEALMAYLDGLQ